MLASSGGEVRLFDSKPAQLDVAKQYVESELPKIVTGRLGAVAGQVIYEKAFEPAIADAWLVVEAVPERLDLKKTIFGDLDRLAPPDAILASNSSSYPSSQINRPRYEPFSCCQFALLHATRADCRRGRFVRKDIRNGHHGFDGPHAVVRSGAVPREEGQRRFYLQPYLGGRETRIARSCGRRSLDTDRG